MIHQIVALLCLFRLSSAAEIIETVVNNHGINMTTMSSRNQHQQQDTTTMEMSLTNAKKASTTHHHIPEYETGTSSSTDFSSEVFTLAYLSQSFECRNIATNFVFQNDLCGAKDPQSYLNLKKSFYSCANRCGENPPYSDRGREECACDEVCFAYDDCCRDMPTVCPEIYNRGKAAYAYLGTQNSYCTTGNVLASAPCKAIESETQEKVTLSTPKFSYVTEASRTFKSVFPKDLPARYRTIKEFSQSIDNYNVIDLSTGIYFDNLYDLETCKKPEAQHYFLPLIVSLDCSALERPATDEIEHATQVLDWCLTSRFEIAVTRFHRSCKNTRLIGCPCAQGQIVTDHVHNACIGPDPSVPLFSRHKLWTSDIASAIASDNASQCTESISGAYTRAREGDTQMSISLIPVALKSQPTPVLTSNNNSDEYKDTNSDIRDDTGAKRDDNKFVTEINRGVERRFLCSSLNSYLSECELLDCVRGAILSHNASRGGEYNGSRCFVPTQIEVLAGASDANQYDCWCFHFLKVFYGFDVWKLNIEGISGGRCSIILNVRQTGKQNKAVTPFLPLAAYSVCINRTFLILRKT